MTEDEYLLALARALTRNEDLLATEARPILLELALRIRALLLSSFAPATSAQLRAFLYAQLRPQILALIQPLTATYLTRLLALLPPTHASLRTINAEFFRIPPTALTTPTAPTLLTGATVLRRPASTLLTPSPTGLSPLTLQLERLLDITIQAAILRDEPTSRILDLITPSRTTISRGSALNAWLDRLRATTASILWSLNLAIQEEAASLSDEPPTAWRWNAVLDPKTCPICRPLDGRVERTPTSFPSGPPPVHPYCRCVLIPITA
jgi:hypothetical protein